MDTSDPAISFDEAGVCNHCKSADTMEKKRLYEKAELPWVLDNIRKDGRGKEYDVLIGLSGGVDSSMALHHLVEQGLRPLCFSVDNGWNTKEADENVMRLVEGLKVPFFRYVVDLKAFKELQVAFVRSGTTNIEIPTDHILMAVTYEMAQRHKLTWIISGGNVATESIMPKAWGHNARDLGFIRSVYTTFFPKGRALKTLPLIGILGYLRARFLSGIKIVNLLDYYEYDRDAAVQLLSDRYGYRPYGEKHGESVFTKWFQNYYLPVKWGYDKRRPHLSSLIASGQMTRDKAVIALNEPLLSSPIDLQEWMDDGRAPVTNFKSSEWVWSFLSNLYAHR